MWTSLLTAAGLSCPSDPIEFLKNTLLALYGPDYVQDVDWYKFLLDANRCTPSPSLTRRSMCATIDPEDDILFFILLEKAYCCYRKSLTSSCFRKWKSFTVQSKRDTAVVSLKIDVRMKQSERRCQQATLTKWLKWVELHKMTQAAAVEKLKRLVNARRLRRIIAAWNNVAMESRRTKEYLKRLDMIFSETVNRENQTGEECDRLSMLPHSLSLKIFQYLELGDRLNCAEVCWAWKSVLQSSTLWSQINVSVEKHWITDSTMKQVLQSYRPFVIYLNLRGCTSLTWNSFRCISECKNLQELNVSDCFNVTDAMIQDIVEGCPCLLYLNLSCTLVTDNTLRELSRNCLNLQYLSLAYCTRFTDKGFLYLTTGKGCHNLLHLNLSGCTQITVNGFTHLSAGCPSLREVVINDMPTLSDNCILALLASCRDLSAISLLDAPHLSDIAFKAISEAATLKSFSTEGNSQLSDVSWKALCRGSQGLLRLHAAKCSRMTDTSLKFMATLRKLQYLDISLCSKVGDPGIKYLTEGWSAGKLRELNVSQCSLITDISVMRIADSLCKLSHLNLSYCAKLTDASLEWLRGSSIRSLDLRGCNIQDQGLAAMEEINLTTLVLAECVKITDNGIKILCQNMKDLEHVDVSHCVALSDLAIRAFSFYCRSLFTLRMSGCPKMTDMAMQYLTGEAQYLRELDVSGCVLLTDRTQRLLERICPPLSSIKMTCCSNISRAAALKLQPRVKHWEHSNDYCPFKPVHNMGKVRPQVTKPIKTIDTWEVVEHSVITRLARTERI
ncbi:dynein regulatory complex subunit 6 [Pleuronectes platessa]|uniref:dynein regulatory complex subunit 6 n=1 Tax=Pleuronectes platessa TaxID=8262 RepID=UPI00232A1F6F|nr:dynein regulatory complex subunit 6 [Pleuronectes platessa]